jgi:Zn-dependent protease
MPLIARFGWAKPVPVNFRVLTRGQMLKVAIAGPLSNILLALVLAGSFHLFRLKAIPAVGNFVLLAIFFNLILAVFNLLPIPPLDGSKIVYSKLNSPNAINAYNNFARYGMFILIGFIMLGGFKFILPVVGMFYFALGLPLPVL